MRRKSYNGLILVVLSILMTLLLIAACARGPQDEPVSDTEDESEIIKVTVETITEDDYAASPGNDNIDEPDAPDPTPSPSPSPTPSPTPTPTPTPSPSPSPTPSPTPTPDPTPTPPPAEQPGDIAQHARSLVGTQYKSGGATPDEGFDNSGFISYVLNRNGVNCPRTTHEQIAIGQRVTDYADLKSGDLVFFGDGSGTAQFGGIYVGGGAMVYSSSGAGNVTQRDITQQWFKDAFVFGVSIG